MGAQEPSEKNLGDEQSWRGLLRAGGFSLLAVGTIFIITTLGFALQSYMVVVSQSQIVFGVPPSLTSITAIIGVASNPLPNSTLDMGARYVSAHATSSLFLYILSAIGYALLIPAALAVYVALRSFGRAPASILLGFAFAGAFVSLISVPSAISTIQMAQLYVATTDAPLRVGFLASAVASNTTLNVDGILSSILISVGIILAGYLMTKGKRFGKGTGYLGMFAGIVGIPTSLLPYDLGIVGSILSVFTLIWILVVGVRLVRLSSAPPAQPDGIDR